MSIARDLAPQIAEQLASADSPGWEVQTDEVNPRAEWAHLVRGDEKLLLEEYRGKLTITGVIPYDNRVSSRSRQDIGVTATRGAATIATEISRRLLPPYREDLAEHKVTIASRDSADDTAHANAAQLAGLLGRRVPEKDGTGRYRVTVHQDDGRGINYGHADVSNTYVRLELSVTPEAAVRMLGAAKS